MPSSTAGTPRIGTPTAAGDVRSPSKNDAPAAATSGAPAVAALNGGATAIASGAAGSSTPAGDASAGVATPSSGSELDEVAAICAFLRKKGYTRLEQTFKAQLEAENRHALAKANAPRPSLVPQEPNTIQSLNPITIKELAAKSAPRDLGASGSNEAAGPEQADAAEALAKDPTETSRGFRMIKNWCEGSLEVYQVSSREDMCV